jgi:hypothetical protein
MSEAKTGGQSAPRHSTFLPTMEHVYPAELSACYPHILEKLEVLWERPEKVRAYFQELLVTQRETRQGFPVKVYIEIFALSEHYNQLYPLAQNRDDPFWMWTKLNS